MTNVITFISSYSRVVPVNGQDFMQRLLPKSMSDK